jgi:hypothetical protein
MKFLYRFSYIAIIAVILTGCSDELNRAPLDEPSSETFFRSQKDVELAVNGVYEGTLHWSLGGQPAWESLDDMTDLSFERSVGYIKAVADGSASASNFAFEQTWEHFYGAIARANNLLENMSKAEGNASSDFLTRVEAEARFLRAYSYSYLSELYGGVPLLTDVPDVSEAEQGRASKSEVVDQIITDLDFAAQNLPPSWGGSDNGRATRGAALALKARVALYNERWETAVQAAQEVMNAGNYSLHPDYREMFQYEGERNSGVILDVPYQAGVNRHNTPRRQGSRNLGAWSQHVPSQFIVDSYQATDGEPIDESSVYDSENPFENRDPRLDASIVRPGAVLGGYVFETHPDSTMTWRVTGSDSVRVANEDATNPFASFTGYLWRKYTDPEDYPQNIDNSELNFILIRYAEVLLTYAEAKIEMDNIDQSVLDAMNRVRARAYGVSRSNTSQYPALTTTSQTELRREVRYERKVELANEGFRLFDIRRWGIAEEVMNGPFIGRPKEGYVTIPSPPEIDDQTGRPRYGANQDLYRTVETRSFNPDRDVLWAIPQDEIEVNGQISQNPNW